jgi:hypothetical protein
MDCEAQIGIRELSSRSLFSECPEWQNDNIRQGFPA